MFSRSGCQSSPSLNETKTARSVPAKSRPLRTGSSRTALTGASSAARVTISCPRLAAVVRAVDVRPQVVEPEAVHGRVGGVRRRSAPASMIETLLHGVSSGGVTFVPGLAAVARDVDQAVVGAGPDRVRVLIRRGDRVDDAAARLRCLAGVAVDADARGHVRRLARQIGADHRPAVAAVRRLEQHVAARSTAPADRPARRRAAPCGGSDSLPAATASGAMFCTWPVRRSSASTLPP